MKISDTGKYNITPAPVAQVGPLCSVVLATYNRPKLLKIAIQSILDQTYTNFEIIVVNDGGCDVSHIVNQFNDNRIKYFAKPCNMGAAHSYNYAIYESKGEYIGYLADDDRWYPNHLAVLVYALQNNPDKGGAYSDQYRVTCDINNGEYTAIHKKEVVFSEDWNKFILIASRNFIPHTCLLHKRSLHEKAGFYDEKMEILIDFDFLRRMAFYTDFIHIKEITGEYYWPVNKHQRITDIYNDDPDKFGRNSHRAFDKKPPRPWDRLKDLNIVLYCSKMGVKTLEQLKFILANLNYPKTIYLILDGWSPEASQIITKLRDLPFIFIFNPEPIGIQKTMVKFVGWYMTEGWLCVLDENTPADKDWLNNIYYDISFKLAGVLKEQGTLGQGRLITEWGGF